MNRLALSGLGFVASLGCLSPPGRAEQIDLQKDPVQITVAQRSSAAVPGSEGGLEIRIGDITGEQVIFEMTGADEAAIIDQISVGVGDVLPFEDGGQSYFVRVVKLENLSIGEDFGVFEITSKRPSAELEAARNKDDAAKRPDLWAQPIQLEGVPNLHKVSDQLYRSAQPTATGMENLKSMGIQTIFSLRSFHSDREEIGETGLGYEHIYVKAWHPEEKEVVRFLQIVTNDKRTPVLLHCQHGADRTGAMVAAYRVAVQGWSKEQALAEMTKGGFGFHEVWDNLIEWFGKLDMQDIAERAGIITENH